MARPLLEIDETVVEKLASIHCTMEEIASVVGCSVDTLERRFADTIKRGKAKGKSSLRRSQWDLAQKGNATMLIWLGKQILGQCEKLPDGVSDQGRVIHLTDDQVTLLNKKAQDDVAS